MSVEIPLNITNYSADKAIQESHGREISRMCSHRLAARENRELKVIQSLDCFRVHKLTTSS